MPIFLLLQFAGILFILIDMHFMWLDLIIRIIECRPFPVLLVLLQLLQHVVVDLPVHYGVYSQFFEALYI